MEQGRKKEPKECEVTEMMKSMYVGKCEYCGAEIVSQYKSKAKRFCNKSCAERFRQKGLSLTDDNDLEIDINGEYICPHNSEVTCKDRECYKCGWNPAVAKSRLGHILADIWEKNANV